MVPQARRTKVRRSTSKRRTRYDEHARRQWIGFTILLVMILSTIIALFLRQ